jgi:hypothetical protein
MRRTVPVAAALTLVLAACGSAAQQSASRFKGDEAKVAEVVDELAAAGRAGDAQKICSEILASTLVTEIKNAGGDCVNEMDRAIADASDYDLQVRSVKVRGPTATAQVRQGADGTTATFTFIKDKGEWRASALGGGS